MNGAGGCQCTVALIITFTEQFNGEANSLGDANTARDFIFFGGSQSAASGPGQRWEGDFRSAFALGHRDLCLDGPFALLGKTHEGEYAMLAVELRGELAAGFNELSAEATGVGGFQPDLVGRQRQAGEGEQVRKETLQGH